MAEGEVIGEVTLPRKSESQNDHDGFTNGYDEEPDFSDDEDFIDEIDDNGKCFGSPNRATPVPHPRGCNFSLNCSSWFCRTP